MGDSQTRIAASQILNIFPAEQAVDSGASRRVPSPHERPRFGRAYKIRSLEPLALPDLHLTHPPLITSDCAGVS